MTPWGDGGMKITVESTNARGGEAKWSYETMFDGEFRPVTGRDGVETAVEVVDRHTNRITSRRDGRVTQVIINVLSEDGNRIDNEYREHGRGRERARLACGVRTDRQVKNGMSRDYDAIVIGAGVIGVCTGFELARRGFRTLNVDKLPAAGYGSTSNTCAIIRLHYSTPDGVAMARESYFYWLDWGKYVGVPDPSGLARYVNTGCLVTKTEKNHYLQRVKESLDELHVAYEDLDAEGMREKLSVLDTRQFGPPVTEEDPAFGRPTGGNVAGAVYIPESGYINDPQLCCHNVQLGCEAHGGEFRFNTEVTEILRENGRVAGVRLKDGSEVRAPVVVNVGGPHSFVINRMAGVEDGMNIKTRALKQEVCHVPAPEGVDYNVVGMLISDSDIGCYSRPEVGNHILIGSEDPPCDDLEWVEDPDDYDNTFSYQWKTQVLREAQRVQGLPVPEARQGTRRPLRRVGRLDSHL